MRCADVAEQPVELHARFWRKVDARQSQAPTCVVIIAAAARFASS